MAGRATAVGTAAWIAAEKENALELLQNEKEEVIYPAQHQLEWLNEHMAEIFSKSHLYVLVGQIVNTSTDILKGDGRRFQNAGQDARQDSSNCQKAQRPGNKNSESAFATTQFTANLLQPLSDVFSSKPPPSQSPQKLPSPTKLRFQIAADQTQQTQKSITDSGYHTASQDDVDTHMSLDAPPSEPSKPESSEQPTNEAAEQDADDVVDECHRTTEGSFHSAKEDQMAKVTVPTDALSQEQVVAPAVVSIEHSPQRTQPTQQLSQDIHDLDDLGSPSDESTPDRPLVRKSSLTFAALPAREPLKSSIGARISRTSQVEQSKHRGSTTYPARPTITSTQAAQKPAPNNDRDVVMHDTDDDDDDESNVQILGRDSDVQSQSQTTKFHHAASTQRLHEKIDMLGKPSAAQASRSIHSTFAQFEAKQQEPPQPTVPPVKTANTLHDDDDDWIKPLTSPNAQSSPDKYSFVDDSDPEEEFDCRAPELIAHEERLKSPVRMSPGPGRMMPGFGHTKSASTATLASPAKAAMAPPSPARTISESNPARPTTTPQGSPRRYLDLSASKSKLQAIMKTAKGLFTSSASISAAAKLETLSPGAPKVTSDKMPGMYPSLDAVLEDKPLPPSPPKAQRKTRSSTEREKEEKRKEKEVQHRQAMETQLEKARAEERKKAAESRLAREREAEKEIQQALQSSPKHQPQDQHAETASRAGRPVRLGREHPVNKAKPAPVSIRVGTLSQRVPVNASGTGQESLTSEPKRPGLSKKASTTSLQSSTSTALKTSVHGPPPKPKALLAAERKKEQDEREAQRKLEQKRELERKRAAQQEEARKQEQKQRAEAEKRERERVAAEQAKRQAQQQAIERKRQEAARKAEQQRQDRAAAEASQARPPSKIAAQNTGRALVNHPLPTNPAKPPKRVLEEDGNNVRGQNSKYGNAMPQGDAKRRKTEDESVLEPAPRPVVSGAPIRQSQLGKKASIFNHPSCTQAQSSAHIGQFPQPPSRAAPPQMQQYATGGKIPFADAPNPPAQAKTPVTIMQQKTIQAVKSSPQYPNGEAIHLPEIPTDSEDDDSDDEDGGFAIPDWATPGHLTEQLIRQEGMDGDAVFGPIAPLKMEEIFAKGSKDRLKRLRDRTSSANWALSGDGLTLEEVRADREQRERMRIEGGWRYGNGS
jgi:hypothetical protein